MWKYSFRHLYYYRKETANAKYQEQIETLLLCMIIYMTLII